MTRIDSPPKPPACCLFAVAAGNRVLVVYEAGTKAKSYNIDADDWEDAHPPTTIDELVSVDDLALAVTRDDTWIYDGRAGRWERTPGPGVSWSRLVVDGSRVIATQEQERFGAILGGAAVFDAKTRRWHRIPGSPDAPRVRDAPWRFVGSTLVWLPGPSPCSTCAHPEHPGSTVEPIEPGVTWTIGAATWQPMASGPVGFSGKDVAFSIGNRLIAFAQLARGYMRHTGALQPIQAESGWWQYSLADDSWSRISDLHAPRRGGSHATSHAIVTGESAFVYGDAAPAIYDRPRNVWTPAPSELAKDPAYLLAVENGRVLALDGDRRPAYLFDVDTQTRLPLALDGFPDPKRQGRSFAVKTWTGRCYVFWGETRWTPSDACKNAPPNMGCDPPPVPTKPTQDGYVWCLPHQP